MFQRTERKTYTSLYDHDNLITCGAGFVYLFSDASRLVIVLENHTQTGISHFAVDAYIEHPREYDSYVPIILRKLDTSASIEATIKPLLRRGSVAIDQANVDKVSAVLRRDIDENDLINPSRQRLLDLLFAADKKDHLALYSALLDAAMTELSDIERECYVM